MKKNIVTREVIEIINNSNNKYMNKKETKVYMAKCSLKRRRWTKKMIQMFYSTPSLQVPNPHYRNAAPMKLYRIAEVLRIEQTTDFINYWNSIAHKREVARALMIERHRKAKELILVPHTDGIGMSNQRA